MHTDYIVAGILVWRFFMVHARYADLKNGAIEWSDHNPFIIQPIVCSVIALLLLLMSEYRTAAVLILWAVGELCYAARFIRLKRTRQLQNNSEMHNCSNQNAESIQLSESNIIDSSENDSFDNTKGHGKASAEHAPPAGRGEAPRP